MLHRGGAAGAENYDKCSLCPALCNSRGAVFHRAGAYLRQCSDPKSGIWFEVELVGGVFEKIANALPFIHAVELERAAFAGNFTDIFPHLWWVLGYTAAAVIGAILLFLRQMKRQ